jgi:hypothetical protein
MGNTMASRMFVPAGIQLQLNNPHIRYSNRHRSKGLMDLLLSTYSCKLQLCNILLQRGSFQEFLEGGFVVVVVRSKMALTLMLKLI